MFARVHIQTFALKKDVMEACTPAGRKDQILGRLPRMLGRLPKMLGRLPIFLYKKKS